MANPPSKKTLAIEAAHWAATLFAFMIAVLSLCWAFYVTTPERPHDTWHNDVEPVVTGGF